MTRARRRTGRPKSSWHAGDLRRRGADAARVTPSADERRFVDLHRPWDRDDWVVSAEVSARRRPLGWRVRRDLAPAGWRATCGTSTWVRTARTSSSPGGTPDLARWLGLDRQSFLATACVAAAQVPGELFHDRAGGLQEQLRQAALDRWRGPHRGRRSWPRSMPTGANRSGPNGRRAGRCASPRPRRPTPARAGQRPRRARGVPTTSGRGRPVASRRPTKARRRLRAAETLATARSAAAVANAGRRRDAPPVGRGGRPRVRTGPVRAGVACGR